MASWDHDGGAASCPNVRLRVVVVLLVAVAAALLLFAPAGSAADFGTIPSQNVGAGATLSHNVDFDAPKHCVDGLSVYLSAAGTNGTTIAGDGSVQLRPRYDFGGALATVTPALTPLQNSEEVVVGNLRYTVRAELLGAHGVAIRYANADTVNHVVTGAWALNRDCLEAAAPSGDPQEIAGTVALSDADRERLDLSWWGSWAIVGLLFVVILAPRWFSAFRVTRGG